MCQKKTLSDVVKKQNSILESITSMTRQINEILTKQKSFELIIMKTPDEIKSLIDTKHNISEEIRKLDERIETLNVLIRNSSGKEDKAHEVKSAKKDTECAICNLSFTRHCDLEMHIETEHVDSNQFECFECGKQFMLKWRLEKHKRMHTSRPIKVCRYFSAKEVCPFEKYGCKFRHSAHSSQNENMNSFKEFSNNFQTSTPEKKVGTRYTCSKSKCSENNQCTHCFVKQLYMDGEVNLDDASSVEFSFV